MDSKEQGSNKNSGGQEIGWSRTIPRITYVPAPKRQLAKSHSVSTIIMPSTGGYMIDFQVAYFLGLFLIYSGAGRLEIHALFPAKGHDFLGSSRCRFYKQ